MVDYLATKDWKLVLAQKDNKAIKKTGVSETLDDLAKARKQGEMGKEIAALERIIEKATEVRAKQGMTASIKDFLAETIKQAKLKQQGFSKQLAQVSKQDDEKEPINELAKSIAKVRKLGLEEAWNFALAPGKPSSGFVLSRKALVKADFDKAFEMKGKRGVFFTGQAFGEKNALVLYMGDANKAAPGMAKAAKQAIAMHAEMNVKVIVRTATGDVSDEEDIEMGEEGKVLETSAPLTETQPHERASYYRKKIEEISRALFHLRKTPLELTYDKLSGARSAIDLLARQIEGDALLGPIGKEELPSELAKVKDYLLTTYTLADKSRQEETRKQLAYPGDEVWEGLALRMRDRDPQERAEAAKEFKTQLGQALQRAKDDKSLVDPRRGVVMEGLRKASELYKQALTPEEPQTEEGSVAAILQRLGRGIEQLAKAPGVDRPALQKLLLRFRDLRDQELLGASDPRLETLSRDIFEMATTLRKKRTELGQQEGQARILDSLTEAMPLLQKAALPIGLIKFPDDIRKRISKEKELADLVGLMSAAAKKPSREVAQQMAEAARKLTAMMEERRKQEGYEESPEDLALVGMAEGALRCARLMDMTEEVKSLKPLPWDPATHDRAAELQNQLFFLEGSLASGAHYEAPKVGGINASGSWWIERPDGDKKTKRKYIFKPSLREARVIHGLPPGSGAPREVLAKRMDELMSGAGLEVGVCPTTLARIDRTNLSGIDEAVGLKLRKAPETMLGSMQQLAQSGPSFNSLMNQHSFTTGVMETFDKVNYDSVAIFDLLYANLDRHQENMLVNTDPVTGRNTLVPIDHGSALPDPDMLQLNRNALSLPGGIFANVANPLSAEPFGEEALLAITRMDPGQMVTAMKQSRDEMANRHGEVKGLVSDAAIEGMGARLAFLKIVAPSSTRGEIFAMLSAGAGRIERCPPDEMHDLVETLREEARLLLRSRRTMFEIGEQLKVPGHETPSITDAVVQKLVSLGWDVTRKSEDLWITQNPGLLDRILAGPIVNPQLQDQIDALLPRARLVDPQIDTKLNQDPLATINLLVKTVHAPLLAPPQTDGTLEGLKRAFQELGGEESLRQATLVVPETFGDLVDEPLPGEGLNLLDFWKARVDNLAHWKAFNEMGGVQALLEHGIVLIRSSSLASLMASLETAPFDRLARTGVMEIPEEEIAEKLRQRYEALMQEAGDVLDMLRVEANRAYLQELRQRSQTAWNEGDGLVAYEVLDLALARSRWLLGKEASALKSFQYCQKKLEEAIKTLDEEARLRFEDYLPRINQAIETGMASPVQAAAQRVEDMIKGCVDLAQNGDNALQKRIVPRLNELVERKKAHEGMPWQGAIDVIIQEAFEANERFSPDIEAKVGYIATTLENMGLLAAEMKDFNFGRLTTAGRALLDAIDRRVRVLNNMSDARGIADNLRSMVE